MRPDDDVLTLLRAADPVAGEEVLAPGDLDAAHDRVRAMLVGEPSRDTLNPRGGRGRRHARWSRALPGLVAAAAIAAVVVTIGLAPGGKDTSPLEAAAAVAAQQPTTIPPPDEYYHMAWTQQMPGVKLKVTDQWWVAADGSGRFVQRMTGRSAPPGPGGNIDMRFGPGRFTAMWAKYFYNLLGIDNPAALPSDPMALKARLEGVLTRAERRNPSHWRAAANEPSADQLVPEIGSALANPLDTPALRSALFKVADLLSGVTVTRHVADPLGRFGTAITVVAASPIPQPSAHWAARYRLIYDPRTSQILAWELIPRSAGSFETFAVSHLVRSDRP
jgi:hypothetical protein